MADIYTGIIDKKTDWGNADGKGTPLNGAQVQQFIKDEFGKRFGYLNMRFNESESMYYIECFASEDDYKLYESDKEAQASLRLQSVQIPISTVEGDTFTATLKTSLKNDANIVVADGNLEVPLNYRSIKISQIGNENANYTGTLIVERSTDGSTWNVVGNIPNVLISKDLTDTDTYQNVNIGQFLTQGRQLVRVRATYNYTNDEGSVKTISSGNVMVGASVTRTTLKLELSTEYHMPMKPTDVNGNVQPFNVTYRVFGSVQKTLFLKIDGGSELKYEYAASVDSVPQTVQASGNQYLTHGVHKVEAWLQCEDGLGGTITSEKLVNRFMMVADASNTKPYLMLQNVDGKIDNFVQTEVAEFAVYAPNQEKVDVAFLLTTYTTDYETNKPSEYFRLEQSVIPQTPNKLLTTVEIEAENDAQAQDIYITYFRVRRISDSKESDFILESTPNEFTTGAKQASYKIDVDNTNAMTPVSGATFLMNPKVRNNNEANPKTILNAKNNNAIVDSTWTNIGLINDGWMTDDEGNKVLRIMAGGQLEIKKNVWAQFRTNPNSSLTFEIDCKISNVTNTTDPIIQMFSGTASTFRGLKMNALEGWLRNGTEQSSDDTLFAWQEDVRTHFSFNLNHQVFPNKGDVKYADTDASKANGSIALARVLVNGDCVREMKYDTTKVDEWSSSDEGSIIIGNEGADIDIYSIRIYENKQIDTIDILTRNYLASLPKADDKLALKQKNDLLDGGLISLEKTKNAKLNSMVWHGILPYKNNPSEQKGWIEIFRYDADGNFLADLSGTICKETKSLEAKGQGSTAKTYYDWNVQDDSSKVKYNFDEQRGTIFVALKDIHESIVLGQPHQGVIDEDEDKGGYYEGMVVDVYGGNLGKNFPLENKPKAYPYVNGSVMFPDGWIDGNGKYRGMGYMVAYGTALAQKRVIKINYASSMQSHLLGACKTYDLLHRKVVGDTPLQERVPSAVAAKHTEPFMYFNQEGNGNTYFKGMGTYGAGKADKVAWGFVKKEMPMYALIEGSDNNLPMTGFRVPFDKNTAVYDSKEEGWLYNGVQNFDFDLGATEEYDEPQYDDGWKITNPILKDMPDGSKKTIYEAPSKAIRDKWADIHNFIYLHSTNLKFFDGTFEQFNESSAAQDTNYKYWCTQGNQAFRLKRYDYINKTWISAGLWNVSYYRVINLISDSEVSYAYNKWENEGTGDYNLLNENYKNAYVSHMKTYLRYFINEKSLQFNYCYVLGFLAGTDNSDKNTYYKIMPYSEDAEEYSPFSSWFKAKFSKDFDFSSVHQLYFDGDDMDSIFRTDNNSHLTKPYYIDRLHPYADENPNKSLYEGMGNQLFNYVEKAYEGTNELASVMNQIMIAATELIDENDTKDNKLVGGKSLWGFLNKYFFNIQRYFPQIAYLEQARIRYEFPELLGYISSGGGARSIRPITQSLGSQLQAELQYMNQRVIYMTSYAGFGAWGGDEAHNIGLGQEADETFGFTPASMPDGSASTYTFTIQTHQYLYPSSYEGMTFKHTHQRVKPNTPFTFTIASNVYTSDTGIGICGINYISDLGDLGDKSITTDLIISGKRLTRVYVSAPSLRYFRPTTISFPPMIKTIILNPRGSNLELNLLSLKRLELISGGYSIKNVIFPESSALKSVNLSPFIETLKLSNVPNLSTLYIPNTSGLIEVSIGSNVGTNVEGFTVQPIVESIWNSQKSSTNPPLQSIHVENVDWKDFDVNALSWLADIPTCELKGTIAIKETDEYRPAVTWDLKNKFYKKLGNIDADHSSYSDWKGLSIDYLKRPIADGDLKIKGNFYVEQDNTAKFEVVPNSIYCNTQAWTGFAIEKAPTKTICTVSQNGLLKVTSLSDTYDSMVIRANVNVFNEKTSKTITVRKTIEIWNRPAQVGDLVYADGTFSSAESYDGEKTPIGICFYVPPRDDNGNVLTKFANPNDKQLRLMVALEEARVNINGALTSSLQWGCMPLFDANNDEQYALYDTNSEGTKVNLTSASNKVSSVYDISAVRNLTSGGLDNAYIDPDTSTNPNGASDYRDLNTDDGLLNDGFKCVTPDKAIGDGFAYNESNMSFDSIGERTLNADLSKLAGSGYKENDIVNSGYAKTLKIIAHRNNLLNNNILGADGEVIYQGGSFPLPIASGSTTEIKALGTLIDQLRTWASQSGGLNDPYPTKWQQLAYPFVSACYAYQPTQSLLYGEVLADKFKSHNWFAPTEGHVARICWYAKYGAKGGFDPFKNAREKGLLGNLNTASSPHWSVTEIFSGTAWGVSFLNGNTGNGLKRDSYVGRAVSAF